ncbi:MAG TPA: S8 family serine peptidase, partial [Pirellulales bacterium]|nr:S8 family serine peptidase [Pirellulales bacterium]
MLSITPFPNAGHDLNGIYAEYQTYLAGGGAPQDFAPAESDRYTFVGDSIQVEVRGQYDFNAFVQALQDDHMTLTTLAASQMLIDGFLPLSSLPDVATSQYTVSVLPLWNQGTVNAQGSVANEAEATLQADLAKLLFGVDGTGIRIGVISDGATGYATSQASGDLPPGAQTQILIAGGGSEGRAMMEEIYDIAPGATLKFASFGGSDAALATAVNTLVASGVDIIVDDIAGNTLEPAYEEGQASQAIRNAVNSGVICFATAGNRGVAGYESVFRQTAGTVAGINGDWQDFDSGAGVSLTQSITLNPGSSTFVFQFDQVWGSVASQVNFYIISDDGTTVLASGVDDNTATQVARQILSVNNPNATPLNARIAVELVSGPAPGRFKYLGSVGNTAVPTINDFLNEAGAFISGADFGHGNSESEITVAASPNSNPTSPESFTGVGPVTRVFDSSGNPLPSVQVINKPDITALDGVSTATPGFTSFFGTSAAAPNAAAIAALLLEYANGLSQAQTPASVKSLLQNSAIDISTAGYDFTSGFGLINTMGAFLSFTDGVLTVQGDQDYANEDDTFRISSDAGNTTATLSLNGVVLGSFQYSDLKQLNLEGLGGNDTLIVDSSNGLVSVPSGIRYDGGAGFNQLQLVQTGGDVQTSDVYGVGPNNGDGSSVITGSSGLQTVSFQNLAPVLDLVPAATAIVNATAAANEINYSQGSLAS